MGLCRLLWGVCVVTLSCGFVWIIWLLFGYLCFLVCFGLFCGWYLICLLLVEFGVLGLLWVDCLLVVVGCVSSVCGCFVLLLVGGGLLHCLLCLRAWRAVV